MAWSTYKALLAGPCRNRPHKASLNPQPQHIIGTGIVCWSILRFALLEPGWAYKIFIIYTVSLQILNGYWVWESVVNRGKINLKVSECSSDPNSFSWNAAQGLASKSFTRPKTVETSLELSAVRGKHQCKHKNIPGENWSRLDGPDKKNIEKRYQRTVMLLLRTLRLFHPKLSAYSQIPCSELACPPLCRTSPVSVRFAWPPPSFREIFALTRVSHQLATSCPTSKRSW